MSPEPERRGPIRVGVSTCLLGESVRYDGGHKRERFVAEELAGAVELVPVCPEVELGLGVPREPIRLVGSPDGLRLVGEASGRDHGERMRAFARERVRRLAGLGLCGYVLKSGSPSCGLAAVPVWAGGPEGEGELRLDGRGLFAAALCDGLPDLPVEEEHRLREPARRERWLARVRAFHRRARGGHP